VLDVSNSKTQNTQLLARYLAKTTSGRGIALTGYMTPWPMSCMAPFSATSSPIYGWSRPFWTSIYFPLHAQQLKGCVRYRERDLAWDRAISKWSRIHRICAEITASREIAFSASNTASKFHSVLASRIVGPNRLYVLGSRGAKLRNLNKSMTGDILIRNKRKQIKQNGQINHTKLYRACMTSYLWPSRSLGWLSQLRKNMNGTRDPTLKTRYPV